MNQTPPPTANRYRPMRPAERGLAAICHLSTLVPVWALVANALVYFLYHEDSRVVCFHARQGIHFQFLFLLWVIPLSFLFLLSPLFRVVLGEYSPWLGGFVARAMDRGVNALLWGMFLTYALICLAGVIQALRGRVYAYPIPGNVWRGPEGRSPEEPKEQETP